jgi:hypothetical protein
MARISSSPTITTVPDAHSTSFLRQVEGLEVGGSEQQWQRRQGACSNDGGSKEQQSAGRGQCVDGRALVNAAGCVF